jgi:hypothetical protein
MTMIFGIETDKYMHAIDSKFKMQRKPIKKNIIHKIQRKMQHFCS